MHSGHFPYAPGSEMILIEIINHSLYNLLKYATNKFFNKKTTHVLAKKLSKEKIITMKEILDPTGFEPGTLRL